MQDGRPLGGQPGLSAGSLSFPPGLGPPRGMSLTLRGALWGWGRGLGPSGLRSLLWPSPEAQLTLCPQPRGPGCPALVCPAASLGSWLWGRRVGLGMDSEWQGGWGERGLASGSGSTVLLGAWWLGTWTVGTKEEDSHAGMRHQLQGLRLLFERNGCTVPRDQDGQGAAGSPQKTSPAPPPSEVALGPPTRPPRPQGSGTGSALSCHPWGGAEAGSPLLANHRLVWPDPRAPGLLDQP